MANPVQRLRYFDGEYLRSYDFTDEQSYHIAMRRLMNRRLHLHGIVYGLEILPDQDSIPGSDTFYSIAAGMAIDDLGREIVVLAPYSLTHVLTGPGLAAGNSYEVWLCYDEEQTTLPAAGYLDCNAAGQYTRWQEGFTVQLIPLVGPSVVTRCNGVRLGAVTLDASVSGLGLAITKADPKKRHFVGIRAQHVVAPDEYHQSPDPYDITAINRPVTHDPLPGYLDVQPGLYNRRNAIVEKNFLVGPDFVLDKSVESALPSLTPSTVGDVKISNDLFLHGNFYGFNPSAAVGSQWSTLKQYIQSLMPFDVQYGQVSINIPASPVMPGSAPFTYNNTQSVTAPKSNLATVSNANVLLAVTQIGWQSAASLAANWGGNNNGFQYSVSPDTSSGIANPLVFNIDWAVGPAVNPGPVLLPVTSLDVSYIVIYTP